MKRRTIITIAIVFILALSTGCNNAKKSNSSIILNTKQKINNLIEPDILNSPNVKQAICDLVWIYEYSPSDLKVIDWVLNEDQLGDEFTGYIVTYEAKNGESYILANILEFEKTKKWEVELVANEQYLTEISKYFE